MSDKLLQRQIKKLLPESLHNSPEIAPFLEAVNNSYKAYEKDIELANRAFKITEEEYIEINEQLKREAEVRSRSIAKLKETIGTITGKERQSSSDDLLIISRYLNSQVVKRKNAELIFSSLIANLQNAILLEDETRCIVLTNQRFCDMFHIPMHPESLKGMDCTNSAEQSKTLFKDQNGFVAGIQKILKEQKLVTGEILELANGRILERDYIPIFFENNYKGHFWSYSDITEKKKTQDLIAKRELTNRLILNSALDAIIIINEEGKITFWNPQAEKIFGWTENEVKNKKLSETIIPNKYKYLHEEGLKGYHKKGESSVVKKIIEISAINKSGIEFPIELSIIDVKQDNNVFFCSFIRDISERKRTQTELQQRVTQFQSLSENIPGVIYEYEFNEDGTEGLRYISPAIERVFGISPSEFKNYISYIHPDDRERILKKNRDSKENLKPFYDESRLIIPGAGIVWHEVHSSYSYTLQNGTKVFTGLMLNITQRKIAEELVKANEEKYRGIIANMNLGLIEVDLNDKIQFVNQSFCEMTGYKINELIGENAARLIVHPSNYNLIKEKNALREKAISDAYELQMTDKGGNEKWWFISGAPRFNNKGEIIGSIGIHLDITDKKKMELELIEAKNNAEASTKAKEIFLANMSHEIRTPMNAILGMASQLAKTDLAEEQRFFLTNIKSAADNLLVIINDILDLSKIEAGKLSLEKIAFKPKEIIGRAMQVMMHKAEEKGLALINTFCDSRLHPVLLGDPYRLNQIMLNLISNAIKFTEKGIVDIKCEVLNETETHQTIRAIVNDSGIGMDEKFLQNLFNKFSQEDETVTRRYGGTGLGMSICKELVELMGGKIVVSSKKNVGTEVNIEVTFEKGTVENLKQKQTSTIDTAILKGKKILVVDDNRMNRMVASVMLQNYGVQLSEASDGNKALEKLKQYIPDIILMDVQMPGIDGLEATRIIRSDISKSVPIIALTAFAIKGDNDKCLKAGMNDYLSKPFEEFDLIDIICKWLNTATTKKTTDSNLLKNNDELYSLKKLKEISRGNKDFVKNMINVFIESASTSIEEMNVALKDNDIKTLKKIAHKLRPSVSNMQIKSLYNILKDVEFEAETLQNNGKLESKISEIEQILKQVMKKILLES